MWESNRAARGPIFLNGTRKVMTTILTSGRRNLIRKLKEMSYRDQLTQIGNRYAMGEYIENLQNE